MDIIVLCDFDGTVIKPDVIDTIAEIESVKKYELQYKQNEISFEKCIDNIINTIKIKPTDIDIDKFSFDRSLSKLYNFCKEYKIDFYILSSNDRTVIKNLVKKATNISDINILANEFNFTEDNSGWNVKLFTEKTEHIKKIISPKTHIVYIGDGISDISAVEYIRSNSVNNFSIYAINSLSRYCEENNIKYKTFDKVSCVIQHLEDLLLNQIMEESPNKKLLSPGVVRAFNPATDSLSRHFTAMHRDDSFHNMFKLWGDKLLKTLDTDRSIYTPMVITGSGTTSMDIVIGSIIYQKTLFCSNGMFGERWASIGNHYNSVNSLHYKIPWGDKFNHEDIIKIAKDNDVKYVVYVNHDTSVGIHNDLNLVNKLISNDIIPIVDCVSSYNIIPISLSEYPMGIFVTNPNKGLGSYQGIGIVVGNNKVMDQIEESKSIHYMNIKKHYNLAKNYEPTNTPCIIAIYASLQVLRNLSYKKIISNYKNNIKLFEYLKENLLQNNIQFLIDEDAMFPSILTCKMNNSNKFIEKCKNNNIIIYPGKGKLENEYFQISLYGKDANIDSINKFLNIIRQ